MPLNGNDRANAIFQSVLSRGGSKSMTAAEQATVQSQLQALYGVDTTYLTTNATLTPGSFNSPAGQAVQVNTATGTGSTSSPAPLAGTGKLT